MSENDLILAMHDMLERVEKASNVNAAAAFEMVGKMLEIAAEERGAFLQDPDA